MREEEVSGGGRTVRGGEKKEDVELVLEEFV